MALNVLVTEDYDLEHFNFNVAFEISSFTGGEEKSIYTEGCIDGSLASETCTKYRIAEGVTSIRTNAFRGLTTISEIKVPKTVTKISWISTSTETYGAFTGCSGLTKIEDISNVTEIGGRVFQGCSSLTSLDVSGADTVYTSAFWGCSALNTITIKNSAENPVFVVGFYDGVSYDNKNIFATIKNTDDVYYNYYLSYVSGSSYKKIKIWAVNKTTGAEQSIILETKEESKTLNNVTFKLDEVQLTYAKSYGVYVNWTE